MPFFWYRQNNSGGSFRWNHDAGITVNVIIEADSPREADVKAEQIGLYFDGVNAGLDCSCCGDRWRREAWREGDDDNFAFCWVTGERILGEPKLYDVPIEQFYKEA